MTGETLAPGFYIAYVNRPHAGPGEEIMMWEPTWSFGQGAWWRIGTEIDERPEDVVVLRYLGDEEEFFSAYRDPT